MVTFKTSGDCRIELVAHTSFPSEGVEQGGWDESDWLPVSAARASFGKEDKTGNDKVADRKLMKFLADHRHVSCFEHNYATFLVECPLFVRSQIHRHTSFKFNEVSRRYTSEDIAFWIPDKWRAQSKSNKQCSLDEEASGYDVRTGATYDLGATYKYAVEDAFAAYDALIGGGVSREQARAVLPQSLLTRFFMTGNLRSFWSFLSSRLKPDTQLETRVVAQRIEKELRSLWPESTSALFNWSNE
jgi:thymidylate synthase (FAD)